MDKLDPKTDGASADITAEHIEALKALFPECVTEGKIDFDVLRELLGTEIEDRPERYSFNWSGKSRARRIAQTQSTGTLRPRPEESVNWDSTQNIFIEGDNLEVLKLLQKSYHKRVKMIYIDPPYNTGNEFIYPDKYQDNLDTYLRYTGQKDDLGLKLTANAESSGRYHTNWLNMMLPRLKLAHNLLRVDGVIFISIDDHEASNLKAVCDEVCGGENFISQICIVSNPRGRQSEIIASTHEYLLVYARDITACKIHGQGLSHQQLEDYKHTAGDGREYRLRGLRHRGNASLRTDRPNMFFPIFVDPETRRVSLEGSERFSQKVLPRKSTGQDGRWEWGRETVNERLDRLEGVFIAARSEWDILQREFLTGDDGGMRRTKWKSVWDEKEINYQNGTTEVKELFDGRAFDYPKPLYLLAKIIEGVVANDDIVMDFFAGSGTTGHAVMGLSAARKVMPRFILVQLPEPTGENTFKTISEVAIERLRCASLRLSEESKANPRDQGVSEMADLGFRVFKLSGSNVKSWDADFDNLEPSLLGAIENIKPDRTELDILYELLLKYGLDLAVPVEEREIAGKTVYVVGGGALIVCFADGITLDVVEGIAALKAELQPEITRVVFKDAGFPNDVVKTNTVQILRQAGIEDVKSL